MTALRAAALALLMVACSGALSPEDLDGLVLEPGDVPPGMVLDERASGSFDRLGQAFRVEDGVDPEVQEGFVEGRERTYVAARTGQRLAFVGSLALLFDDHGDARQFMAFSHRFQVEDAPAARELPADGLGDAGYGVRYPPDAQGNESYGYVWRVGEVVLTVAVGGAAGATDAVRVLALAEVVDERVP